jgi:hypothetical protein
MRKKGKHVLFITILLVAQLLLIGAKLLDVELRNVDETEKFGPLVDMNKIVDGNSVKLTPVNIDEIITPSDEPEPDTPEDPAPNPATPKEPEKTPTNEKKEIRITVSGDDIYIYSIKCTTSFESSFERIYTPNAAIELVDDYANYMSFVEVQTYLDDNGITYSIEHTK